MNERDKKEREQAGAELCQAQVKLGLAMLELLIIRVIFSVLENWVYWGGIPSTKRNGVFCLKIIEAILQLLIKPYLSQFETIPGGWVLVVVK